MNFENRTFVIFDASSSHKQLLFRSFPSITKEEKNLDILMQGVSMIFIPTVVRNISIEIGSEMEMERICDFFSISPEKGKHVFIIREEGVMNTFYFVIAERILFQENDYVDTSLDIKREDPTELDELMDLITSGKEIDFQKYMHDSGIPWTPVK